MQGMRGWPHVLPLLLPLCVPSPFSPEQAGGWQKGIQSWRAGNVSLLGVILHLQHGDTEGRQWPCPVPAPPAAAVQPSWAHPASPGSWNQSRQHLLPFGRARPSPGDPLGASHVGMGISGARPCAASSRLLLPGQPRPGPGHELPGNTTGPEVPHRGR